MKLVFLLQPPNNAYSTRISRVEFPRFDGTQVKEWLYKCEQFFTLGVIAAETRVRFASIHLDGIVLQWHLNYMASVCGGRGCAIWQSLRGPFGDPDSGEAEWQGT